MPAQSQPAISPPDAGHARSPERGITFRAVTVGVAIVVFINLWVTYAETVVHSSRLNLSFF